MKRSETQVERVVNIRTTPIDRGSTRSFGRTGGRPRGPAILPRRTGGSGELQHAHERRPPRAAYDPSQHVRREPEIETSERRRRDHRRDVQVGNRERVAEEVRLPGERAVQDAERRLERSAASSALFGSRWSAGRDMRCMTAVSTGSSSSVIAQKLHWKVRGRMSTVIFCR